MEKHTDVLQQPPPGELTLALEIGATSSIVMPDRIACTVCQHEIPASEALVAEATDYVVYFCGLDCYERWRNQAGSR
jgi:Domain of unknown function (DUF3330)